MKTKSPSPLATQSLSYLALRRWLCALLTVVGLSVAQQSQAASQTWTNAPVSTAWTNVLNWVAKAVPGDVNNTAANSTSGDIATFNSPLLGGIGGAANPIIPDDATVVNGRSRRVCGIVFDTTNCGAYVLYSPSPAILPDAGTPGMGILYVSHNVGTNAQGVVNGAIRINESVTNSQAILVPLYVNLPSSTAGIYYLVNNSTNPGVSLTINSITHQGATTRATTFILDGTNTAPNVVTNLSEGGGNGTGGFTKQGPNTWVIAGPGTFPTASPLNIINGTLVVQDAGAFGVANTAIVGGLGTLRIDNVTLTTPAITLTNGGTIRVNGSVTINGITAPNSTGTSATLATTSASDFVIVGNTANKVTGGNATSLIHLSGPGTIQFDQANNYIGKFSLDSGTNQLTDFSALGLAANYNLNAGAVLDLTLFGASTYQFTPKALSANGTGTTPALASMIVADAGSTVDLQSRVINLTFLPTSFSGDTGHPALYLAQGTLSCNGNAITVNNASGTPLGVGTYQIVHQAAGSILSSGAFVTLVTGSGLAPGTVGEIVASGGNLNLVVTAYIPKNLVWTGSDPLLPGVWDRLNSTNWLSGITPVTFNIYDSVTFDAAGSAQPVVNLTATMVPSSVVVDTSANNYTFSGVGQIAGGTTLVKKGTGTLFVNTANTFSGGTLTTNGTLKLGIENALPSTGLGDVTNNSPGIIDMNGFNDTIGALNGNGTVDVTGGGTATLTMGDNDNSGTFTGLLQNSAGTLNITKTGLGTETLTRSNSYVGTTDIEAGILKFTDPNGVGNGASAVVINGGTLDLATNLTINSLAGAGGTIANLSTTATNTLVVNGAATTTFSGAILNGAGKIAVKVLGGSLRMQGANTYTNGTIVGSGATFQIHNSPAAVTGAVIASNTATLGLSGGSGTPGTPTTITTADGATVTFTSGAEGNIWGGQFLGSATATNLYTGPQSAGGSNSFAGFLGVVRIALTSGNFRFFNGGGLSGGDNTTFVFEAGNVHTRDAQSTTLGSISGGSATCGIGGPGTAAVIATWIIGAKNLNNTFQGYISGSNSLVKAGSGTLTLDGAAVTTNTDSSTFTNYTYASVISYLNTTTVSNGVLALSVPNDLSSSPTIILAVTNAVLNTANMGYVSNFTDVNGDNAILVTNGTFTLLATTANGTPQLLGGFGVVKGSGVTNNGTINPGLTGFAGTLSISNSLVVNAGASNYFDLSDDPAGLTRPSDQLLVQGNVVLTGGSVIGISALNGNLQPGKYTLIKYGGNLINESGVVPSGPVANLTLGGVIPATSRATMVLSNAPGELDLIVVSINAVNLTWTGDAVSNLWDVVNSTTFASGVTPSQFYQMDNVIFDDSVVNPTNLTVTLSGTMAPGTFTVNAITNYTFGGSGNIQGATTLVKKNTGSLILTNGANSYSGGTVISNGLLSAGADSGNNQNDLALGTGPVTVNTLGELRFGGNAGNAVNHFVTNTIVINGGTVKAQDGVQHLTNSTVTVGAPGGTLATVFGTKNLVLDSPLLGTGPLTIAAVPAGTNVPGGQVILAHGTNTFSGSISIVTNGNLALVGRAGLTNVSSIDVQLGAILDLAGRSNTAWSVTSGQTLKGNGSVRGRFITADAGSTISPGNAAAIGTLQVTNQSSTTIFATITLAGTLAMDINRTGTPTADRLLNANGTNNLGGTLTVNNLGGTLVLNDSFQLLVGTNFGAFATVNLPVLTSGLMWTNTLAQNGRITVISTTLVPTIPPAITNFSLAGGNVVISGTNGQAGGTYYLLMTTNVATLLPQWRTVATNVLGAANFTFIGTNTVTLGASQQFYRLSSTNFNP